MDKQEERRRILGQVADGTMSPSEAAERLAVLDEVPEEPQAARHTTSDAPATPAVPKGDLARVRVVGSLRSIEIYGDPSVREAVAEGPHQAWRDGDLLIIETEQPDWYDTSDDDDDDDFRAVKGKSFSFGPGRKRIHLNTGNWRSQPPVRVRMHPDLELDAEVQAGTMTIRDVHGPISAEVDAGTLRVKDFRSPIEVRVNAGSFTGNGVLDRGDSRIDCNAGKVDLRLEAGSSVRINASSEMGKVVVPNARHTRGPQGGIASMFGQAQESVVGGGEGDLTISVNVGAATVRAE